MIVLDDDAAGHGWSLTGEANRIDLRTAVAHEIGHLLGVAHGDGVMSDTLEPGQQSVEPSARALVFAAARARGLTNLANNAQQHYSTSASIDRLRSYVLPTHEHNIGAKRIHDPVATDLVISRYPAPTFRDASVTAQSDEPTSMDLDLIDSILDDERFLEPHS